MAVRDIPFRPEEIELHDGESPAELDARNVMAGRIVKAIPAETHYRVEIDCGTRVVAAVSRARFREMRLETGRRVRVTFPAHAAHLIRPAGDAGR